MDEASYIIPSRGRATGRRGTIASKDREPPREQEKIVADRVRIHMTTGAAENALNALVTYSNGYTTITREGGTDRATLAPNKGLSGRTLVAISRWLVALRAVVVPYQEAVAKRTKELAADDGSMNWESQQELKAAIDEMRAEGHEFDNPVLSESELKFAQNFTSGNVIAFLTPILKFDDDSPPAD